MMIAGVGCRAGAGCDEIAALVRGAARTAGVRLAGLAAPDFKAGETGLNAAAAALGLPLMLVAADALAAVQAGCVTRSARVAAAVGVASVAEGCALAAAGVGAVLLLPRITGVNATCAIAGSVAR